MKGIICYYSGSGNTKLACQYIAKKIKSVEFDLCNIVKDDKLDLNEYDVVGFATWADFMGAPQLFHFFIEKIELKTDKPAFIFNTYGAMSGKTLRDMENTVKSKGFNVICGYSLHAPENYPPSITKGRDFRNSPNMRSLEKFDAFITGLENTLIDLKQNKTLQQTKIKLGLLNSIMPKFPRTKAREDMGEKFIDETLCNECGICEESCPYGAIELHLMPVFDMDRCYGCWACYNHCPQKAIYTKKVRGKGHYPKPNEQLLKKLNL